MLFLLVFGVLLVCCCFAFPTSKVHRVSRRKLGRGQHVQLPLATAVVTSASDTATITFSVPVVVNGSLDLHVTGLTLVSQIQVSSTVWHLLYSGPLTGIAYVGIPSGSPVVQTMQGGGFAGIPGGTF